MKSRGAPEREQRPLLPSQLETAGPAVVTLESALLQSDASGAFHRRAAAYTLLSAACAGPLVAAGSFLITPVGAEARLSTWGLGAFASAMPAGIWAGSLLGGVLCDWLGPARIMTCAVFGVAAAGVVPALGTLTLARLLFSRGAVGMCGIIVWQAANTYLCETSPASVRTTYMSVLHVAIAVGCAAAPALALLVAQEEWRTLLVVCALPAAIGALPAIRWAPRHESPRWLLVSGRERECIALLDRIATMSAGVGPPHGATLAREIATTPRGGECSPIPKEAGPSETFGSGGEYRRRLAAQLCHPSLWRIHMVGAAVAACVNFANKGSDTWAVAYLEGRGMSSVARLAQLGAQTGKVAGSTLNLWVSDRYGRVACCRAGFYVASALLLTYLNLRSPLALVIAFTLFGVATDIVWCNLFIFLAESYPSAIRSTAFGIVIGVGRTGAILASPLGAALPSIVHAMRLYAAAFALGGAILTCCHVDDTARRPLADVCA